MEKIRVTGAFASMMIRGLGGGSGEGELLATWKYPDQQFLDPEVQQRAAGLIFREGSIFYRDSGHGEVRWIAREDYEVIS
jgi:hypothetical protein